MLWPISECLLSPAPANHPKAVDIPPASHHDNPIQLQKVRVMKGLPPPHPAELWTLRHGASTNPSITQGRCWFPWRCLLAGFCSPELCSSGWPLHFWGQVSSCYLTPLNDLRRVLSVQFIHFVSVVRVRWQLPSSLWARSETESPGPDLKLVSVFLPCAPPSSSSHTLLHFLLHSEIPISHTRTVVKLPCLIWVLTAYNHEKWRKKKSLYIRGFSYLRKMVSVL